MVENEIVIGVQNVIKNFKIGIQEVPVLRGISFDVHKGDFVVIFGPSGSGKSTLLHTLLGLEPPTSGKIIFLGQDLYALPSEDEISVFRKMHIGMVYQQPNWVKSLTVLENVAFPMSLLGVSKTESLKKSWEMLRQMQMSAWVNYRPTELSGGQQQKVALCRALVNDPQVIIADEPTGNLDYESGLSLMELLVELNNQNRTILMVTHDLEYMKYSKTAVQFLDGKIVQIYTDENKENVIANIKGKRGTDYANNTEQNS